MGSIPNWENWNSLEQVSNNQDQDCVTMDRVGTSPFNTTTLTNNDNNYVNVTMLELVKGLLEGQISTVQSELVDEKDERKDNEARLTTCIKKLVEEVKKLSSKLGLVEGRIDEIEKWRDSTRTPPAEQHQQRQLPPIAVVISSTGGRPSGNEISEALARFQMKMENDHFQAPSSVEDSLEVIPTGSSPVTHNTLSMVENNSQGQVETSRGFQLSNVGRILSSRGISSKPAEAVASETVPKDTIPEATSMARLNIANGAHGLAPTPGRFLSVLCICGLEFDSEASLSEHVLDKQNLGKPLEKLPSHPDAPIKIRKRINFVQRRTPKRKRMMKHGKDPSQPGICLCGRDFRKKARQFCNHINYYSKAKSFNCETCGAGFVFAAHLRVHLKRVHGGRPPLVESGRKYASPRQLGVVGNNERPATEITGSAIFQQRETILPTSVSPRHGKIPSQPRVCLCGMKYRHEFALYQHIRYFTKLKPTAFSRKATSKKINNLTFEEASSRKALAEKPNPKSKHGIGKQDFAEDGRIRYFCKCGTSYYAKLTLKRHILGDSLEKQFGCELCPKRFLFHSELKNHMICQHKMGYSSRGQIFACSKCAELFASRKLLFEHRREAHSLMKKLE